LIYACSVTIAVLAAFFTLAGLTGGSPGHHDLRLLQPAAVTLLFAHLAWPLGARVYPEIERRNRGLLLFALLAGYACAGLSLFAYFAW
jgi:hypothetical protein